MGPPQNPQPNCARVLVMENRFHHDTIEEDVDKDVKDVAGVRNGELENCARPTRGNCTQAPGSELERCTPSLAVDLRTGAGEMCSTNGAGAAHWL